MAFSAFSPAPARADKISEYPCSPKYSGPADFCAEVWAKTLDSTWMVFDVSFKKPVGGTPASDSAKLMQYNGMFFNAYRIYSKDDTTKQMAMPMGAAQKWEYPGLAFRRYYAHTVSMEDMIAKMEYKATVATGVRGVIKARASVASGAKRYTLDGRNRDVTQARAATVSVPRGAEKR